MVVLDCVYLATWASGNVIGVGASTVGVNGETIPDASKTAVENSRCGERYTFKLPTGQAVPRVTETYRLLGHEVNAHVGNEVARDSLVYRASLGARVISQCWRGRTCQRQRRWRTGSSSG